MRIKRKDYLIIIFLIIIVLFNAVGIVLFNSVVYSELSISSKSSLRDMANEHVRIFSLVVENNEENVNAIVELVQIVGDKPDELIHYMQLWEDEFDIQNLMLVEMNGRGINSQGQSVDLSSGPHIGMALEGNTQITSAYVSEHTGDNVLAVTSPIYFEGTVQGAVVAEYSIEYLSELLSTTVDSRGSVMVVNGQGEILIHTYPFEISFENFANAEFEEGVTYDVILEDFSQSRVGSVTFTIQGDRKFGEYIPLGIEDWTLFFEISESTLSSAANNISDTMTFVSVSTFLAFIVLIIYVLYSRKKSLLEIEQMAYFDKFTGLFNLVKFKLDVEAILKEKKAANVKSEEYALLKFDLENFKAINEVFGFETGNKVILKMANIAQMVKGNKVKIARTGTDEFMIFATVQEISDFLSQRQEFDIIIKKDIPNVKKHIFNFKYGRYFVEKDESNIDDIVNKLNMAHSFARAETKSTLWDYDDKFKQHLIHLTELTNKMRDALKNKEFKLFLQPKYNLEDESIVGAEALVRWIEQDGKMIYPSDFIPLFEKNEFVVNVDKFMFEQTCILLGQQIMNDKKCVPISVNFSRLHLKNNNLAKELKIIAEKHDVPTSLLEVEITETTVAENKKAVQDMIISLRNEGFCVSIDDFGSGHSSLGMLKDYKVDVVKLDRSFFVSEPNNNMGELVIKGITHIVNNLGAKIIAEGIETKEQIDFLRTTNCHYVQGYYFAKPMCVDDFKKILN